MLNSKVDQLQQQLDVEVYKLFDLNRAEIKLLESQVNV